MGVAAPIESALPPSKSLLNFSTSCVTVVLTLRLKKHRYVCSTRAEVLSYEKELAGCGLVQVSFLISSMVCSILDVVCCNFKFVANTLNGVEDGGDTCNSVENWCTSQQ